MHLQKVISFFIKVLLKQVFLISIFVLLTMASMAQYEGDTTLRSLDNNCFNRGEFLKYRVFYESLMTSWITAGTGTIYITNSNTKFNGRHTYHIEVLGKSEPPFSWFFKVRDRFETYLDEEAMMPWKFIRRTSEGKYKIEDEVHFDPYNETAQSSNKLNRAPRYVQDIVSAFYYIRTMNFDTAKIDDEYFVDFFLDDSVYHSKIIFMGREKVKTEMGTFNCLKFKPSVATGEVFQEKYPMELWVTDDRNKIPIMGKSAVYVGSVTIELIKYDGLMYPLGK